MSDRILTERIRSLVLNSGMDLVGFGPVERWENAPYLLSPKAILPEAKTVVVAAIHITDTWTEMGGEPHPQDKSPGGWMDQNSLMDRIAYRVARLLNDSGHEAIAVASSNIWRYRAFEGLPSLFAPDLSHIHAATAAGLAEIGWCGLAITPEFGARCRFISIVTSADLVPTPMYDGPKLCDMCMECVKHCPTSALKKELKKPHEVVIGGKTFRYANKNIWRCAWAEHFELNLDSEGLKSLDHVGEAEILQELEQHGRRGHERGVCQKFCVPPHLRSEAPSFGRDDKKLTLNRINRRYPESMPTLRKMRDDLIAHAVQMGADIAGVGLIDAASEIRGIVETEAPGMRTAIGLAIRMPGETFTAEDYDPDVSDAYDVFLYLKLHHICIRIGRMIEDYGYHSTIYMGNLHATLPGHHLAEMAGLGRVSGEGRFETPEFGEDVYVAAIVTDAALDPTPRINHYEDTTIRRLLDDKDLRALLERIASDNLVSGFGVAPAGRFDAIVQALKANIDVDVLGETVRDTATNFHGKYEPEVYDTRRRIRGPKDYMPDAESVIVLSMHYPAQLIGNSGLDSSRQIGTYAFHQYQTTFEMRFAALEVVRALQEQGHSTIISENMLGIGSRVNTPRGFHPDARCGAIEAVAAGMGRIGRHGALLTPEHGAHQRQIVIITNAKLPADGVHLGEDPCLECAACSERCPMDALTGKSFDLHIDGQIVPYPIIPRHRCDWSKFYALCSAEGPALIGSTTDTVPPDGDITVHDIAAACAEKDPVMKCRTCILESCLRACPAGPMADIVKGQVMFRKQI